MRSQREKYLGLKKNNNQGVEMTIIEYVDYDRILVEFSDEQHTQKWTNCGQFKDGDVRYPYLKKNYKSRTTDRLGNIGKNKRGETMKIIEYNSATDIVVEFQDQYHGRVRSSWSSFKKGSILNPNQKLTGIVQHAPNFIDITGKIFNNLKVICWDTNPPDTEYKAEATGLWKCECLLCGSLAWATKHQLESEKRKTCRACGIKNKNKRKKHNEYDLSGDYGIGYTYDTHKPFYFDKEDYELIKDYSWRTNPDGFIVATKNSKKVLIHRIIMGVTDRKIVVDHIAHQRNDNRKANLRLTTTHNNTINDKVAKNNKSGVTGVCWNKQCNKWQAYIWHNGKGKGLGYFENFEDAVAARHAAEDELFGEYSYRRSMELAVSL